MASLTGAEQFNKGAPAKLAFLAMTQHRLGHKMEARAALARLREAVEQSPWNKDEEAHALLREADGVIRTKAAGPAN